jgi:hypothetical protein
MFEHRGDWYLSVFEQRDVIEQIDASNRWAQGEVLTSKPLPTL